jgi:copper chaperone
MIVLFNNTLGENNMSETSVLTVTGMKCGGCENTVKTKLQAVEGVISVALSFKENQVTVEFDTEKLNLDAIKSVITQAGFTVG